jgi:hypothetical protein
MVGRYRLRLSCAIPHNDRQASFDPDASSHSIQWLPFWTPKTCRTVGEVPVVGPSARYRMIPSDRLSTPLAYRKAID